MATSCESVFFLLVFFLSALRTCSTASLEKLDFEEEVDQWSSVFSQVGEQLFEEMDDESKDAMKMEVEQLSSILGQVGEQLFGEMNGESKGVLKDVVKAGLEMKNRINWDQVQEAFVSMLPNDETEEDDDEHESLFDEKNRLDSSYGRKAE